MRVYRVERFTRLHDHSGSDWFTSKREANARCAAIRREDREDRKADLREAMETLGLTYEEVNRGVALPVEPCVTEFDFDLTKSGVLELLRLVASHPDNG